MKAKITSLPGSLIEYLILMFTLSSNKDQRKNSLSPSHSLTVNGPTMSEDEIRKAPTNVVGVSMSTYYHTIHLKLYDNCNCQAIPDINRTLVLIHF